MKQGREKTFCFLVVLLMVFGSSVFTQANADWSIPLQISLNGSPLTPLPLEFGMKNGASDGFDNTLDAIAPLSTPEGDDVYFLNITGEISPYNKLLKDYRGNSNGLNIWKVVLTVSPGKVVKVDWGKSPLPAGKTITWQDADRHWNGRGPLYYFTDTPRQIELANTGDDLLVKWILIKAN